MVRTEKRPTLATVAREANVALMTASKVFKGDPSVRSYIKERVLQVAGELDYKPNLLAQALRNKSLKIVSLHISHFENPFFGTLYTKISKLLTQKGYMTIPYGSLGLLNEANETMYACATIMVSPLEDRIRQVVQRGPLVTINAWSPIPELAPDVSIDFKGAYTLLALKLLESGHSKIGIYCDPYHYKYNHPTKFAHLENALSERGIQTVRPDAAPYFDSLDSVASFLKGNPGAIDALICGNDIFGMQAIRRLELCGYKVPQDVVVVGCDNSVPLDGMWTLHVDTDEIAKRAANMLFAEFAGKGRQESYLVKPELRCG